MGLHKYQTKMADKITVKDNTLGYAIIPKTPKEWIRHHLESFDDFIETGLDDIIVHGYELSAVIPNKTRKRKTEHNPDIQTFQIKITFPHVELKPPVFTNEVGKEYHLTPTEARKRSLTYAGRLYIDFDAKITAIKKDGTTEEQTGSGKNAFVGYLPIMTGCSLCPTKDKDPDTLRVLFGENASEAGGLFIIKGKGWAVNTNDSTVHNKPYITLDTHEHSVARMMFLSKPGDGYENSYQTISHLMDNGLITISITTGELYGIDVPFQLLYRIMGIMSDKEIYEYVLYDIDDKSEISSTLLQYLDDSYDAILGKTSLFHDIMRSYDTDEILMTIATHIWKSNHEDDMGGMDEMDEMDKSKAYDMIYETLNKFFLPHIGKTADSYREKLIYMGTLIRRMILTKAGFYQPTDLHSLMNKRMHPPGYAYARGIKNAFMGVIRALRGYVKNSLTTTTFSHVKIEDIIRKTLQKTDLDKTMRQSIATGMTQLRSGSMVISNRISSQALTVKNQIQIISVMRTLNNVVKGVANYTAKTQVARAVNPSQYGFACVGQTPDDEHIGKVKQLACSVRITGHGDMNAVLILLAENPDIIQLAKIHFPDVVRKTMSAIYVNGTLFGFSDINAFRLRDYYINNYRRKNHRIGKFVTVYVDHASNELYIWDDLGRMVRPILRVFTDDAKSRTSPQYIKMTSDILHQVMEGLLTTDDLCDMGILEYISPAEQDNCLIARNVETLMAHSRDPLLRFTHCDISISHFGAPILHAPYAHCSQLQRGVMFSKHVRQACGWAALNLGGRWDREFWLQLFCESPVLRTIMTKNITPPNGFHMTIAYVANTGHSQEDSASINKALVDRGAFGVLSYTYIDTERETNEEFGDPVNGYRDVKRIKVSADYTKLESNGLVKIGTLVTEGTVLIGKIQVENIKGSSEKTRTDRSVVYKKPEPAIVDDISISETSERFLCKIKLRTLRLVRVGAKFSSRAGNKAICSYKPQSADAIYSILSGVECGMEVNPHSIPSRMIIGQLREAIVNQYCALLGIEMDGTICSIINPEDLHDYVMENKEALGITDEELEFTGLARMGFNWTINGITGEFMRKPVFMCPNYYQRLQKFIEEIIYAVNRGTTNALTRQPLRGKSSGGTMKMAEMEGSSLMAHGTSAALTQKMILDSDGTKLWVCKCGAFADYNKYKDKETYSCPDCGEHADIGEIQSSWITNVLRHLFAGMGISMKAIIR